MLERFPATGHPTTILFQSFKAISSILVYIYRNHSLLNSILCDSIVSIVSTSLLMSPQEYLYSRCNITLTHYDCDYRYKWWRPPGQLENYSSKLLLQHWNPSDCYVKCLAVNWVNGATSCVLVISQIGFLRWRVLSASASEACNLVTRYHIKLLS